LESADTFVGATLAPGTVLWCQAVRNDGSHLLSGIHHHDRVSLRVSVYGAGHLQVRRIR